MHSKGAFSPGYSCAVLSLAAILMMAADHPEAGSNPYDVKSSPLTGGDKKPAPQPVAAPPTIASTASSLRVHHIRLEPGPTGAASPSSTLKFEIVNDGASRLTNIVVEVSVVKRVGKDESNQPADALVRPFIVRQTVVLLPGYSVEYEVRFQNLAPDCDCVPRVEVVSVDALTESAPSH